MATVRFYPIDATYKVVNDATQTYIFGRTAEGKQICVIDNSFQPYFYIVPRDNMIINEIITNITGLSIEKSGYHATIKNIDVVEGQYQGRKINAIKITVNRPTAPAILKEHIKKISGVKEILEADIPFRRKYWIERQITPLELLNIEGNPVKDNMKVPCFKAEKIEKDDGNLERLKILAFDIETYNPLGKTIRPEEFPILMISFYGKGFKKVITWKRFKTEHDYIEFVDGEGDLIERFKEVIEEYAPDALAGYYSDGFDLPYLMTRAEKHKIRLNIGLDNSSPRLGRGFKKSVETRGLVHLDVLNFIRKMARKLDLETLKLDDVAQELLGERKDEVEIDTLAEVWDAGGEALEKFCEYNLKDSQLTHDLLVKIIPNITELVKLIGQPMPTLERMGYGQLVEWYLMKRSIEFDELIPNKPYRSEVQRRQHTRVKGGFVFEPRPGIYKDLYVFDFRSLYPTIMITHNISPETINCSCCVSTDKVPGLNRSIWFCKKRKGFFPSILDDVVTRRLRITEILKTADEEKKVLLEARQESLKMLANSFYGYLGFSGARWYSKECTEAVTAYGRHYIQQVIDKAEEKGFEVVYSDTDSVFLDLNGKTKEDIIKFGEDMNYGLPELMELEYEGHYKTGLFVATKDDHGAKKKYALLTDKRKVLIKGFEAVRRNWSLVTRNVQETVIKKILKEEKADTALAYVKKKIARLREKKVPVEDVVIQVQLMKPIDSYDVIGPHVAVAKIMKTRGEMVEPGSMIRYVIVEGEGKLRDRAKLPEDVKKEDYDAEYYVNNQLVPSVEKIFEMFGHNKEELLEEKEQSKLDSFFEEKGPNA